MKTFIKIIMLVILTLFIMYMYCLIDIHYQINKLKENVMQYEIVIGVDK
jgi:hypothetical protein